MIRKLIASSVELKMLFEKKWNDSKRNYSYVHEWNFANINTNTLIKYTSNIIKTKYYLLIIFLIKEKIKWNKYFRPVRKSLI